MIVKWNNNIVDYKCKVFFFFFFTLQIHPFFMLVYVLKKRIKRKREHATYVIRDSYYKPVAPALCWCNPPRSPPVIPAITPSRSRTRVSSAGGGRSNKERQRLQPLASIGLHTTFTGIHICYTDIPQWVLTRHLRTFSFFVVFCDFLCPVCVFYSQV